MGLNGEAMNDCVQTLLGVSTPPPHSYVGPETAYTESSTEGMLYTSGEAMHKMLYGSLKKMEEREGISEDGLSEEEAGLLNTCKLIGSIFLELHHIVSNMRNIEEGINENVSSLYHESRKDPSRSEVNNMIMAAAKSIDSSSLCRDVQHISRIKQEILSLKKRYVNTVGKREAKSSPVAARMDSMISALSNFSELLPKLRILQRSMSEQRTIGVKQYEEVARLHEV